MDIMKEHMKRQEKVKEIYSVLRDADGLANVIGLIESLDEKEAQEIIKKFVYEYVGLRKTYKWE